MTRDSTCGKCVSGIDPWHEHRSAACDHRHWRLLDDGDFQCHGCGLIEGDDDDDT